MTAAGGWRVDGRGVAAVALFGSGALLSLHGFWYSDVIQDGLLAAWQPKGVRQLTLFLLVALALVGGTMAASRTRVPLAVLVGTALAAMHGVAAVASVALLAAAALGLGWRLSRGAALRDGEALEASLLRMAAGLAVLVTAVELLAHFPVNVPATHLALLALAVWIGRGGVGEAAARGLAFCRGAAGPGRYAAAVLIIVLAVHAVVAAIPEAGSDAFAVHLTVPHQVAAHGQWSFDFRHFAWAVTPMGADWLYTAANMLGGEGAARLANFGLLAMVALLVRGQVGRALPKALASLMVAGCAAAPIVFQESTSLWVENLLTAFLLAAGLVVARTWRRPGGADVVAFALCLGGACQTKSLGLFGMALAAAMAWSVARSATAPRVRLRRLGEAALVLLAVGGGPYLYAFAVTGNPLFPYFNDVFQSPYYGDRFVDSRWTGHAGADLLYQLTFHSSLFGELYDGALGFHHLLLLPAGLAVALLRWPTAARVVLVAIAVEIALFVTGTQYIRYLYPFLWTAVILEAEAVRALLDQRRFGTPALVVLGVAFLANLAFLPTGFYLLNTFPVDTVFSPEARALFVESEAPYRRLNETVNALAGTHARVLYVTEPCGAFLEGTPVYSNWHNTALAERVKSDDLADLGQVVSDEQITHVILAPDPDLPRWREWLALHGRKLEALSGNELYEIVPPADGPP
jgi:hypothetical protein